ncbi:MAG: nucleotidyltransferase domain-containing protein, partial [Lachnospiraceae bacterium]|nr:nucleotidyltransferase domain-containing protein [Lachnospiraceae bacterium]
MIMRGLTRGVIMPTIDVIKKNLEPIFGRYNVKKAILFGSYAKGQADERSD